MSALSTPAIVLHAFPYGESSKIVRLATADLGVVSAIAKGARRTKSRFGARLQPLSHGIAQLYVKPTRDLQTLAEFDLDRVWTAFGQDISRYAAAAALAEVVLRVSPQEPHPGLFDLLSGWLEELAQVDRERVPERSLAAMWSVVVELGFAPSLDVCAVDGQSLSEGVAPFSVSDGGFVCPSCARSRHTQSLAPEHRRELTRFVAGDASEATGPLPAGHAAAHRRLLSRFVRSHVAEGKDLRALDFWEGQPWRGTS